MNTLKAALAAAREKLPASEARLLLGYVLDRPAAWLIAHDDDMLEEADLLRFASLVARRKGGEPVAYLVGHREFYGREFAVSPAVLIPRPETEMLVDLALAQEVGVGATAKCTATGATSILDLGTGSGCIAVTLALEIRQAEVTAVDTSAAALSVAREREQGTFDQLLVTPLTPMQILIGKALPSILIGLLQSTIIFLIIRFWFEIPMQGSVGLLYFGLIVFTVASVGVGLSISALSLTMQQAMLYTFLLIMPLMLLSGLFTPVRNMPEVLQLATYANPLRFGMDIVRRVYLEGAGLIDIWRQFIPLLVLAATTLPLAAWLFRNRLS